MEACGITGVALFLVGGVFHLWGEATGINVVYDQFAAFRTWSGFTEAYMTVHPLGYGFVFATTFLLLRHFTNFPGGARGGTLFGLGLFVSGSLPI